MSRPVRSVYDGCAVDVAQGLMTEADGEGWCVGGEDLSLERGKVAWVLRSTWAGREDEGVEATVGGDEVGERGIGIVTEYDGRVAFIGGGEQVDKIVGVGVIVIDEGETQRHFSWGKAGKVGGILNLKSGEYAAGDSAERYGEGKE